MSELGTTVTVEVLRSKANNLDQVVATYCGSVNNLYRLTEELNRMWDGGASQAFQIKFESEKVQFENGAKTLNNYTQAIRDSANTYVGAENQAINIING
jgi:WXG100 family type VII secretion target